MDNEIEKMIVDPGLEAPRVTIDQIKSKIIGEDYYIFPGTTVTICLLKLQNGYTVTGESACVSDSNFDEKIGRTVAKDEAINKIWTLEGYLLKQQLYDETL